MFTVYVLYLFTSICFNLFVPLYLKWSMLPPTKKKHLACCSTCLLVSIFSKGKSMVIQIVIYMEYIMSFFSVYFQDFFALFLVFSQRRHRFLWLMLFLIFIVHELFEPINLHFLTKFGHVFGYSVIYSDLFDPVFSFSTFWESKYNIPGRLFSIVPQIPKTLFTFLFDLSLFFMLDNFY